MPTKTEIAEFSDMMITIATEKRISIMDAIIHHCEITGLEIDMASSLISPALRSKIREEAQELNLLKKSSKLPL